FEKIVAHLKKKKRRRLWLSLVGGQLEATVVGLVWPLLIFQAVGGYETIGFIKSAAAAASILTVWFMGHWIDRRGKSVLRLGTLVNGFNLLIRSFLMTSLGLFLADASYSITSGLVATPFESAFYEEATKMRKLEFMVERELVLHLSGVIICGLIGLLVTMRVGWFWLFSLGAVGLWLETFILDRKRK
ncbi:hypothetical protein MUP65_01860, partial [Patescibacteria group bacterium]|nr:hypothetical protein [Patescibacteria group bacterium]